MWPFAKFTDSMRESADWLNGRDTRSESTDFQECDMVTSTCRARFPPSASDGHTSPAFYLFHDFSNPRLHDGGQGSIFSKVENP
jgi:hypothetical protein